MPSSCGRGRCMEIGQQTCRPKPLCCKCLGGIVGDHLIIPCLIFLRLGGRECLIFLQWVLLETSEEEVVHVSASRSVWFQHDKSLAHFINEICELVNITLGQHCIRCDDPVHWPVISPDLVPWFLLGSYESKNVSLYHLKRTRWIIWRPCRSHFCSCQGGLRYDWNLPEC